LLAAISVGAVVFRDAFMAAALTLTGSTLAILIIFYDLLLFIVRGAAARASRLPEHFVEACTISLLQSAIGRYEPSPAQCRR